MGQTVTFIALEDKVTCADLEDAYAFRKDRPAHWLQKICFYILKKLKAYHFKKTISVERHEINAKDFMERLFIQRRELQSYFNIRPTVLLIGAEDYKEMMGDKLVAQAISFKADYWLQENRTGDWNPHGVSRRPTLLGITVHVIPWMRGCLLLTDDQLK